MIHSLALTGSVVVASVVSAAPEPTTSLTVEDRKSSFVPTSGPQESSSAEVLLVVAYALMWAVVFGFVWLNARRQKALDARLALIEDALRRADAANPRVDDPES